MCMEDESLVGVKLLSRTIEANLGQEGLKANMES